MRLLLGYLLAVFLFIGGGYAGLDWLANGTSGTAPIPNLTGKAAPVALSDNDWMKKPLAPGQSLATAFPKQAAVAEPALKVAADAKLSSSATSPPVSSQPAVTAAQPAATAANSTPPQTIEHTNASDTKISDNDVKASGAALPSTQTNADVKTSVVAATDSKPSAAAAADGKPSAPVQTAAKSAPAPTPAAVTASTRLTRKAETEADRSPLDANAAATQDANAAAASQEAAAVVARPVKKRHKVRVARGSRAPVKMVLRTIQYADGHIERRLLPMPQARQTLAYSGRWSPFFDE